MNHNLPRLLFVTIVTIILLGLPLLSFAQKASKVVPQDVVNGKAIKLPAPAYPPAAKAVHASGAVNVQVTIDETGKVISAVAVSGHPLLRMAAETAAKQAEFKPTILNKKAVKVTGIVIYNFVSNTKTADSATTNKESASKSEDSSEKNEPEQKADKDSETRDANGKVSTQRKGDKPTAEEIKTMLEAKFTSIYEDHYCCKEKNKVEFEWLAPIQIGGQTTQGRIPVSCWATKIDVKVTFTKRSSGETGSVRRGFNGNPIKEVFCIHRDAFDEWDYLTYEP